MYGDVASPESEEDAAFHEAFPDEDLEGDRMAALREAIRIASDPRAAADENPSRAFDYAIEEAFPDRDWTPDELGAVWFGVQECAARARKGGYSSSSARPSRPSRGPGPMALVALEAEDKERERKSERTKSKPDRSEGGLLRLAMNSIRDRRRKGRH